MQTYKLSKDFARKTYDSFKKTKNTEIQINLKSKNQRLVMRTLIDILFKKIKFPMLFGKTKIYTNKESAQCFILYLELKRNKCS